MADGQNGGVRGGIVAFYAYPHSGATLLSRLLTNIPGMAVTPEMEGILKPVGGVPWGLFLDHYNRRFDPGIGHGQTIGEIASMLEEHGRFLLYRVWVPADNWRGDRMRHLEEEIEPTARLFLHRNFFHVLGSLHSRGMLAPPYFSRLWRMRAKRVEPFVSLYMKLLDLELEKPGSQTMSYEELIRAPFETVERFLKALGASPPKDEAQLRLSPSDMGGALTGDYKAMQKHRISSPTKYTDQIFLQEAVEYVHSALDQYSLHAPLHLEKSTSPIPGGIATFMKALARVPGGIGRWWRRTWKTAPRQIRELEDDG